MTNFTDYQENESSQLEKGCIIATIELLDPASRMWRAVCSLSTSFSDAVCPRTMWAISWNVVLCGSAATGFTAISRPWAKP